MDIKCSTDVQCFTDDVLQTNVLQPIILTAIVSSGVDGQEDGLWRAPQARSSARLSAGHRLGGEIDCHQNPLWTHCTLDTLRTHCPLDTLWTRCLLDTLRTHCLLDTLRTHCLLDTLWTHCLLDTLRTHCHATG